MFINGEPISNTVHTLCSTVSNEKAEKDSSPHQ